MGLVSQLAMERAYIFFCAGVRAVVAFAQESGATANVVEIIRISDGYDPLRPPPR